MFVFDLIMKRTYILAVYCGSCSIYIISLVYSRFRVKNIYIIYYDDCKTIGTKALQGGPVST